jgi:hypothetical protein
MEVLIWQEIHLTMTMNPKAVAVLPLLVAVVAVAEALVVLSAKL